jgi:Putative transposase
MAGLLSWRYCSCPNVLSAKNPSQRGFRLSDSVRWMWQRVIRRLNGQELFEPCRTRRSSTISRFAPVLKPFSKSHTHSIKTRYAFFLPVKVLSRTFRGKFVAALKRAFRDGQLQFYGDLALLAQPKTFSSLK